MFENRVMKKIFQLKREEVTEDPRKSLNEKLHDTSHHILFR